MAGCAEVMSTDIATSQSTDAGFIVTAGMPKPSGARPHQNCAVALNPAKGITFPAKIHALHIAGRGWTYRPVSECLVFAVLFKNVSC